MAGESRSDQCAKECNGCRECRYDAIESGPTLKPFSDKELQEELKKRKLQAKAEFDRAEYVRNYNHPIIKEIAQLQVQIDILKRKLKV